MSYTNPEHLGTLRNKEVNRESSEVLHGPLSDPLQPDAHILRACLAFEPDARFLRAGYGLVVQCACARARAAAAAAASYSSWRDGRWANVASLSSENVPLTMLLGKKGANISSQT